MEQVSTELINLQNYINQKTQKTAKGGRENLVESITKNKNTLDEMLNFCELLWIKGKPLRQIAKTYNAGIATVSRVSQELEPFKDEIVNYLLKTPRRKTFYNRELDKSDYESVQNYINRAHRDEVRNYKNVLSAASRVWTFLKYKNPENWTADDILSYLQSLTSGAQSNALDAIRQVAPQIKQDGGQHQIRTGRFREKLARRKKDLFGDDVKLIIEALEAKGLIFELVVFQLHVTLGCREGSKGVDSRSGLSGLSWDRFTKSFSRCDVYESKVRAGIWSRDCPVDQFFPHLPQELRAIWTERGKPITDKVLTGGYNQVREN